MGKRLRGDALMDSLDSLQAFHRINGFDHREFNASVTVRIKESGEILFTREVPIRVVFDNVSQFIDIDWKEAGIENFRGRGLFGGYNPNYNEMTLNENSGTLEIYSDDSDKVVEIYY